MKTQKEHKKEQKPAVVQKKHKSGTGGTAKIEDNRPSTVYQRKLRETMNASAAAKAAPVQRKVNNTGLPDTLKTGIENLSGYAMDDVKVHYNSGKPAQLQAHAYAQGTDIHIASGQEKHLPHEAWHVVQQKQGRVKPTMQLKSKVNINDDVGLEKEADVMGARAEGLGTQQTPFEHTEMPLLKSNPHQPVTQGAVQRVLAIPNINPNFMQTINDNMQRTDINRVGHAQIANMARQLTVNDLNQMYTRALAYIGADPTGVGILTKLRNYQHNVTVQIGYDAKTVTEAPQPNAANQNIVIKWNPLMFFGVWSEGNWGFVQQGGVMSPAAVLLHEFGHACQYIDDPAGYHQARDHGDEKENLIRNTYEAEGDIFPMEHHNMTLNEVPFNKANNEPVRDKYTNAVPLYDYEYNQNATIDPLISGEFDQRIQYIINNGWVNAVDQHTNVQETNDHRILNDTYYNSDNLGTVMDNEELIYVSSIMLLNNHVLPHINNSNWMSVRGGLRNLIRYLGNWIPLSVGLKGKLNGHVQNVFTLLRGKGQNLQGLDGSWNNL